jgi:hypothetical protein
MIKDADIYFQTEIWNKKTNLSQDTSRDVHQSVVKQFTIYSYCQYLLEYHPQGRKNLVDCGNTGLKLEEACNLVSGRQNQKQRRWRRRNNFSEFDSGIENKSCEPGSALIYRRHRGDFNIMDCSVVVSYCSRTIVDHIRPLWHLTWFQFQFECNPHPPYSPDITPCNYHISGPPKEALGGNTF